jgi:predicted HTH domain antitoxin
VEQATLVELHVPIDILTALRARQRAPQSDEERLKIPLAVGLFAAGTISLAKAARLAGMARYQFAALLATQGLPAYEYGQEEYREDLDFLASAHGQP